jgi:DNA-binding NarL/FixJ family response regulator
MPQTSVLLVDDHQLVREALRDTLANEADIEVVGEAGDAATALERTRSLAPDVVVLDIGLPDLNGIEAAGRLRQQTSGSAKIVALSAYTDRRFVTEMLRAGASAYVTKSSAGTELVRAIRAVASGQTYICPEAAESLVSAVRNASSDGEPVPRLSPREREVLKLIAEGVRSPAIAEQLHISVGTVEVHRRNIMRKLDLRTVAELTRYAVREGLASL